MGQIIQPPYFESVVNAGEKRLLDFLQAKLPDDYYLIPNVEIASTNPRNYRTQFWEYDLVVVAPHAIYNIENKDWKGQIEGNDDYWYVNDRQRPNPIKTARQKTAILASKLKSENYDWGKAWIDTCVSLSYPNTFEPLLFQESARMAFTLGDALIKHITDPGDVGKYKGAIKDVQDVIVQFLVGKQNQKSPEDKKFVQGYEIIEILKQESNNYIEYLVKPKGVTSNIRKRVKEYALQVVGLSPTELKQREETIKNQYNALQKIRTNPFILSVEFNIDEENHLFYEITDLLEEDSLRAIARSKTFTFNERINIIKNIMSALKAAHQENIFHRDVNPENIFLNNGYAYLGNFGKSYFTDHNDNGYTVMHTISELNASPYHPHELIAKDASRASDMYSLGVLIAWLFTEKEPIKNPFELDRLGGSLPKDRLPSSINKALPVWLDEICRNTILTNPDDRWNSIEELEEFIENALQEQLSRKRETKKTEEPRPATDNYEIKEGDKVGDYIIIKTLGRGGYSRVFKAKHNLQGRSYALKLFHESVNKASVIDEYNALQELSHPHIVKFNWNGQTPQGQFYTTTEFLDGDNLSNYIKTDASLSTASVFRLAQEILSALVYLQSQEKPILHRDVKPQNIIEDSDGRFVLIDFNVASISDDTSWVGTNPYLPPDLLEGQKVKWDFSADTFALGITLYELLSKQYPWQQTRIPSLSIAPTAIQKHNERISDVFAQFLMKAVNARGEDRFESAQAMLDALNEIGRDNLLKENPHNEVGVSQSKLYHIKASVRQDRTYITLLDNMSTYGNIRNAVRDSLSRFKDKIAKYKSSISLAKPLTFVVKMDDEILIKETFWEGGARNFNEGNINRIYAALTASFSEHTNRLKQHKIDVEGIDIVDYINSLYSQSTSGNWGTRVNDKTVAFDQLTYSPSKLDKKLIPDILDAQFKLIVITGNAGDGKTAFIRKIENNPGVRDLDRYDHKNGSSFKINGINYESNYDGSQDEDGKMNNDVLEEFFAPFKGLDNYDRATEGRIIAINEGRLVEFLKTSVQFKELHDTIDQYFYKEGHATLPRGLMIINLNLRSITAIDEETPSLFRQQVRALTRKELWNNCEGCPVADKCFIRYNVESLNDSAAGEEVITRLEWLLRTVALKRELHITMRDLRSLIAFMLTRDHSCEQVAETYLELKEFPEEYWQHFYFNITSDDYEDSGDNDRLVRLLRQTDVGQVSIPDLDRDLFFGQHKQRQYLDFAERSFNLLNDFNNHKISVPAHEQDDDLLDTIQVLHRNYIRHQYFEGRIDEYHKRLPYQSLLQFHKSLNQQALNGRLELSVVIETIQSKGDDFKFTFKENDLEDYSAFAKAFKKQVKEIVNTSEGWIKTLRLNYEDNEDDKIILLDEYKNRSWTDFKKVTNPLKINKELPNVYESLMNNSLVGLKASISQAISMNEGCDNEAIWKKNLVLRSSEINDPFSKSFRLFDLDDFELFVNRTDHLVRYLEYEPDSLIFRHKKHQHIALIISLDLFEMLYFIQKGFSPSLNDLRGKFIELTIFKNLLENLAYKKVVVTQDNNEFYEISKGTNNSLQIESLNI